jgi:HPt (histidine-containing phosphotransfer) domain-containing protein
MRYQAPIHELAASGAILMSSDETANDVGLDLIELFARVEYDRDLLNDMLVIFKQEFPRLYQSLSSAVSLADFEQIKSIAHTLKGMLASLSFRKASATALRIEKKAQLIDLSGIPAEVQLLEHEVLLAQSSLEKFCAQVI